MSARTSTPRRAALLRAVAVLAAPALLAAPVVLGAQTRLTSTTEPRMVAAAAPAVLETAAYSLQFDGIGAEGTDMIWTGGANGAFGGHTVLRVAYSGTPVDQAKPLWPVRGILLVTPDDPARAFAAEVEGEIDW